MSIKKFVLTATMTASLFALTVPASFAGSCNTCDVAPACETGYGCPIERVSTCDKCDKCKKDKCKCKDKCKTSCKKDKCKDKCATKEPCNTCPSLDGGHATGAAASLDKCNKYGRQAYAYPGAVYSNANEAIVGDALKNNAMIADKELKAATGVLVEDFNCMTGAAMPIIDETCGFAVPLPCDCAVQISSPTSIQVTKKYFEPHTFEGTPTGAAAGPNASYYPDVPNQFWAADEINRLTCQDVLAGYPDGYFKPNRDITRAELITMAVKGFNLQGTPLRSESDFADVSRCHWAYEQINKGVTNDILEGKSDCIFDPEGKMTRLEALNAIGKGMSCPMDCAQAQQILAAYTDGNRVPSQFQENVAKAVQAGALKHQNQKTISLNREATRAEVSTMLQNMRLAMGLDNMAVACEPCRTEGYLKKTSHMTIPTIEMCMKDIISAKDANVGDQFAAETLNEVTIAGTSYPAGSRVRGKVMEVIRPNNCEEGAIRLSFEQIEDCSNCRYDLPKQVLTARVEDCNNINFFARLFKAPFTWTGSVIGTAGRTVGGALIGLGNAAEDVLDNVGNGTGEIFTGQFRAAGRSYQDALKSTVIAPVDLTRTALMGVAGEVMTTVDEVAYLVNPDGKAITQVNPNQKITVAFGQ